jgi:hypothetical protein
MVSHSEAARDHGTNPRQGPALGLETGPQRPPLEDVEEILPLLGRQPRGAARFGAAPQRCESVGAVSQSLGPLADGRAADTQLTGDLGSREVTGAEQPARFDPSLFDLFGSKFSWSPHAYDLTTVREFVKRLT